MDLRYTADEQQFRAELRQWLADVLPGLGPEPYREDWDARRAWDTGWQRLLFDAGYAGINWPREYGGRGATPTEHLIFIEETERARAPYVGMNFVGLLHAGPTLVAEASDEQKAFHLPGILKGEHVWCQGFSEPNAGSDLASLRTRAVRDGDDYVISGQKIWTSYGHVADYCEMLVRTDTEAPKHRGISWLIVPMDTPGIDVRPLLTMEGTAEFCEVFFDDVRVPVVNRVGDENDGWRVAMVTLSFERGTAFVSDVLESMELVRDLAELAKTITSNGATRWEDAGLRRELGRIAAEFDALWALTKRNISQAQRTGTRRRRRQRVQDRVVRPPPASRRHRDAAARPRIALARRRTAAADRPPRARALLRVVDDHRRRHVAGEPQHRGRARARPAERAALMDFELTSDQESLQEGMRSFLDGRFPLDAVRDIEAAGALDRARWRELGETGVFSLTLPEADGGLELGISEAALVFEELGRALVPGPLVATFLAAPFVDGASAGETIVGLFEAGGAGQRDRAPAGPRRAPAPRRRAASAGSTRRRSRPPRCAGRSTR